MQVAGSPSWCISVDRWVQHFDWALWFRAAERIDVSAGGVVPGGPDITPLPDPSTQPDEAAELAEGWLAWWHALADTPRAEAPADPGGQPAETKFGPPDFSGLADWPALHRVVTQRWCEANDWHTDRKRAGTLAGAFRDRRTRTVLAGLEEELGRKVQPFSLELVVLPVSDDEIRRLCPQRYLVPETLHDGQQWPDLLRTLVKPLT